MPLQPAWPDGTPAGLTWWYSGRSDGVALRPASPDGTPAGLTGGRFGRSGRPALRPVWSEGTPSGRRWAAPGGRSRAFRAGVRGRGPRQEGPLCFSAPVPGSGSRGVSRVPVPALRADARAPAPEPHRRAGPYGGREGTGPPGRYGAAAMARLTDGCLNEW